MCFHQYRVSKHRRPGSQGQLRTAGSNSGSQVDQRKHPGLQRRPKASDHFWLWCWSIVCQPANPLTLLRRYMFFFTDQGTTTVIYGQKQGSCHQCIIPAVILMQCGFHIKNKPTVNHEAWKFFLKQTWNDNTFHSRGNNVAKRHLFSLV